MAILEHDAQTTTYDKPALMFPAIPNLVNNGITGQPVQIDLTLTSYVPPRRSATVTPIGTIPIIDEKSNLAFGGQMIQHGGIQLPKLTCEGHIDTPCIDSGAYRLCDVTISGIRFTYGELIAMFFEGRAASVGWQRIDPIWFRDPYGRQFTRPRILDFTASFVEAVPGRTNFTLQLKV